MEMEMEMDEEKTKLSNTFLSQSLWDQLLSRYPAPQLEDCNREQSQPP